MYVETEIHQENQVSLLVEVKCFKNLVFKHFLFYSFSYFTVFKKCEIWNAAPRNVHERFFDCVTLTTVQHLSNATRFRLEKTIQKCTFLMILRRKKCFSNQFWSVSSTFWCYWISLRKNCINHICGKCIFNRTKFSNTKKYTKRIKTDSKNIFYDAKSSKMYILGMFCISKIYSIMTATAVKMIAVTPNPWKH